MAKLRVILRNVVKKPGLRRPRSPPGAPGGSKKYGEQVTKVPRGCPKKLHRGKMTPNSSVFLSFDVTLQAFRTMRNFIWCLKHFNGNVISFCRRPMTEHVKCLLLRCGILNSLGCRVLKRASDHAVHIWLPKSVGRLANWENNTSQKNAGASRGAPASPP